MSPHSSSLLSFAVAPSLPAKHHSVATSRRHSSYPLYHRHVAPLLPPAKFRRRSSPFRSTPPTSLYLAVARRHPSSTNNHIPSNCPQQQAAMNPTATSSQLHCSPCQRDFPNKGSLVRHQKGQYHKDIVAGVPTKVRVRASYKKRKVATSEDDADADVPVALNDSNYPNGDAQPNAPGSMDDFGKRNGEALNVPRSFNDFDAPNISDKLYSYSVNIDNSTSDAGARTNLSENVNRNPAATQIWDPNSAYAQEQREFWDAVIQPDYVPAPITTADLEKIDLDSYIQMEADTRALLERMGETPWECEWEHNVVGPMGDWGGIGDRKISEGNRGGRWST
ncbi:hypothetical protein BDZ45DRAFT_414862 [Acephala macrosclerotiorum]|nr:hypothetical protein BDZ45DRAFT_414862 [Acephala macrosclerotiorum]